MTNKKVRLASVTVKLNIFLDDGETLEPTEVQAVNIPAPDWVRFAESGIDEAIADIQRQINTLGE